MLYRNNLKNREFGKETYQNFQAKLPLVIGSKIDSKESKNRLKLFTGIGSRGVFLFFAAAICAVFYSGNGLIADQQIILPNTNTTITSPTPVQAIVLDSNGNMTEEEYMYNPETQVVVIDSNSGGNNASLFFPLFAAGFIWSEGYWVNHEGNYYVDNHWVHVNDSNWNNHWHDYWNNHWDNHWHNYWNQHHNDPNFRYHNQEHWQEHNFRGGQRSGGDYHRAGGGRSGGGGRR